MKRAGLRSQLRTSDVRSRAPGEGAGNESPPSTIAGEASSVADSGVAATARYSVHRDSAPSRNVDATVTPVGRRCTGRNDSTLPKKNAGRIIHEGDTEEGDDNDDDFVDAVDEVLIRKSRISSVNHWLFCVFES